MFRLNVRLSPDGGAHENLVLQTRPSDKLSALRQELGELIFADAHFLRRGERVPGHLEDAIVLAECIYPLDGALTVDVENFSLGGDRPS